MPDRLGDKARLQHMLDAIGEIQQYIDGVTMDDFWANSMMFNATLRQLEIIGEAANHLSEALLQENPQVPWARISGLRNVVIHEYFGIDDLMIWTILKKNLPELKTNLQTILQNL